MIIKDPKDPFGEGPEAARARRNRSFAIAGGLIAFIIVIFAITLIRLMSNVAP